MSLTIHVVRHLEIPPSCFCHAQAFSLFFLTEWINILDAVIFLDLALLIGLSAYQYHLTAINITLSGWAYVIQLILVLSAGLPCIIIGIS